MKAAAERSYLGIGACVLFGIAAALIVAVIVANLGAQHKMAGFEGIVVLPFALLLNIVGCVMAAQGMQDRTANPLSRTGLCLNLLPILWVALSIAYGLTFGR